QRAGRLLQRIQAGIGGGPQRSPLEELDPQREERDFHAWNPDRHSPPEGRPVSRARDSNLRGGSRGVGETVGSEGVCRRRAVREDGCVGPAESYRTMAARAGGRWTVSRAPSLCAAVAEGTRHRVAWKRS